jgi:hypothetical protein
MAGRRTGPSPDAAMGGHLAAAHEAALHDEQDDPRTEHGGVYVHVGPNRPCCR